MKPSKDLFLEAEFADKAAAIFAEEPCRVRFVDDEPTIAAGEVLADAGHNVPKRCDISVHAVDRLHGHEDRLGAVPKVPAGIAPRERSQHLGQAPQRASLRRRHGVVPKRHPLCGPAHPHAVVGTGVDEFIVDDRVSGLDDAAEKADSGIETRVEEEAGRGVVEGGDLAFQGFGFC